MLKNKRLTIAGLLLPAIVLFSMGASSASAAFFLNDWKYVKSISLPASLQEKGAVEFTPDLEVFAGSAAGLVDLRIITGGNTEVPYKLEVSKAESERTSTPVTLRDQGYLDGGQTTFTAVLRRAGNLHNEIEFQTPATNFRGTAVVETSYDGETWMTVARQTVYNFTVKERNFTTSNTGVRYPDSATRYLRVTINEDDGGPVEVTGATVFFVEETIADEITWPVQASIQKISRDTIEGLTFIEVDTRVEGVPSHRLAIKTPEVNFHRQVTIQASADRESWATVLSTSDIYAYDTAKFVGSHLDIIYPETTRRYLRITIRDEDSPPITIKGVNLWSLHRRLVFLADPQQSYHLYYGNADAPQPSYDIEHVFPYLDTEELPGASLSPQATNLHFVEKSEPVTERFPWLFPVVIAVAVAVVALILLGIVRQAWQSLLPPSE